MTASPPRRGLPARRGDTARPENLDQASELGGCRALAAVASGVGKHEPSKLEAPTTAKTAECNRRVLGVDDDTLTLNPTPWDTHHGSTTTTG